jgi:hypothetical protein
LESLSPAGHHALKKKKKMMSVVEEKAKDSIAFVFDLLGNSSVRFEQFGGTTALPFKSNSKFHIAGKVVVTPPETFRKIFLLHMFIQLFTLYLQFHHEFKHYLRYYTITNR